MIRRLLIILILSGAARAQSPSFSKELWHTTWNDADEKSYGPACALPPKPIKPAMWSLGITQTNWTAAQVAELVHVCRYGGAYKGYIPPERADLFPANRVPRSTLLICDFEGAEQTQYPELLCGTALKQTKKFAMYPTMLGGALHGNMRWMARNAEVDLYDLERTWSQRQRYVDLSGDYVLLQLYHSKPEDADAWFGCWLAQIANVRAHMPRKKILALTYGCFNPLIKSHDMLSEDLRHRHARFIYQYFDGAWFFGTRQDSSQLMRDVVDLASGKVAGWPGWPTTPTTQRQVEAEMRRVARFAALYFDGCWCWGERSSGIELMRHISGG